MNTCHSCQIARRDRDKAPRPSSPWRRGGEFAGWIIPSATLVLLPKCPACVLVYVALFSSAGISFASAAKLRTSLLILCVAALLCLAMNRLCRLASRHKTFSMAETHPPASETPEMKP